MSQKIAIIGSGNVARHLAPALENAGNFITEVYSRNLKNAKLLASKLYDAQATDHLDFSDSKATVFIIAVSDNALEDVVNELLLPVNAVIAHTSGTSSLEIFNHLFNDAGILYPVQTFSSNRKIDWKELPICIEASTKKAEDALYKIAQSISNYLVYIDSEQRKKLHIGAVIACNFSNHLFTKAKAYLEANDLDFELLEPLLIETVNKALENGPENSQTGPAVRNDTKILKEHLKLLEEEPDLQKIYQVMTESILKKEK